MPIFHQPHNSVGNHTCDLTIYDYLDFGLHFHKNYEFIYVISGTVRCEASKRQRLLRAGDFALCMSNEIHSIRTIDAGQIWIGVFSEDFIGEFVKYRKDRMSADFTFRCAPPLSDYIMENLIKTKIDSVFVIKSCLYALCNEYLRENPLIDTDDKTSSLIGNIVEYVSSNYKSGITLASAAEALGYEYCYFSKIFNRLFSMSFKEYVNTYRYNEACNLLLNSDMTITEIAHESGFQSIRSFNDSFKRRAGTSPREYICSRTVLPKDSARTDGSLGKCTK